VDIFLIATDVAGSLSAMAVDQELLRALTVNDAERYLEQENFRRGPWAKGGGLHPVPAKRRRRASSPPSKR